jgi:hypothetical protein
LLALNPFAHFILIHTILQNIFASQADATPSDKPSSAKDRAFATQYALHDWLQMTTPKSTPPPTSETTQRSYRLLFLNQLVCLV